MKDLFRVCLLGTAMAVWCTGCAAGGKSSTSPDPVPSGPPDRFTGTAVYVYQFDTNISTSTQTFNFTGTWVKVANPSPAPPAGTTRYVAQGGVHVSWRQRVDVGRCTMEGDGDYPLPTPDPNAFPVPQTLDVGSDGRYQGRLGGVLHLGFLQICATSPSFSGSEPVEMRLDMAGTVDGKRMHGDMPPAVLDTGSLTAKGTGSWDFTAN